MVVVSVLLSRTLLTAKGNWCCAGLHREAVEFFSFGTVDSSLDNVCFYFCLRWEREGERVEYRLLIEC